MTFIETLNQFPDICKLTNFRFALAHYVIDRRVLDLVDGRETHITKILVGRSITGLKRPRFRVWHDSSIHKMTGTGTIRQAHEIILL